MLRGAISRSSAKKHTIACPRSWVSVLPAAGAAATKEARESLESSVAFDLRPLDGHPFDVVVLDEGNPLFAFKVITEGRLIYSRDAERITDVVARASRAHVELSRRHRLALQEIVAEAGRPMPTDADRVSDKIAHIRKQVTAIEGLVQTRTQQQILGDPWVLKGLKYSLQTAIEAMIDVAYSSYRNEGRQSARSRAARGQPTSECGPRRAVPAPFPSLEVVWTRSGITGASVLDGTGASIGFGNGGTYA